MEKPELVANPVSVEGFKEYFDMFDDDQIEEAFSKFLPMYLNSCKCFSKDKVSFLEEFVEKLENDLEALEGQIQSQDFHYRSLSFEDPFQLPLDVKIEKCFVFGNEFDNPHLKQYVKVEDTHEQSIDDNQIVDFFGNQRNIHDFYDPIDEYMEGFFNLNSQPCLHCEKQKYYKLHLSSMFQG